MWRPQTNSSAGFRNNALKWICTYRKCWYQKVITNGTVSRGEVVNSEIQGLSWGSLILLYGFLSYDKQKEFEYITCMLMIPKYIILTNVEKPVTLSKTVIVSLMGWGIILKIIAESWI